MPVAEPMLDQRSLSKLAGIHPDLARVVLAAAETGGTPFIVTEGLRSPERQRDLVRSGASRTLRSRHLTGHAVDLAACIGGRISWEWRHYAGIAGAMLGAAAALGIPVEWGGEAFGPRFRDGPHFQLPWRSYP